MKKTLIALMALASVASAALTEVCTLTGVNTYTFDADVTDAAVTVILSGASVTTGNEGFASFALTGSTVNYVAAEYRKDATPDGVRVTSTDIGTAWGNAFGGAISKTEIDSYNTAWATAEYAALTFAIDSTGSTQVVLSVIDSTGVITNIGNATVATNVTFDGIDGIRLNKNGRVTEAFVYTGTWSSDDLVNVTSNVLTSKVVPEPATATLSLLALAGLCARRRRA